MTENRVLYNDEKIKIECDPRELNGHILQIGDNYHFLPRNCLDDLYRRETAESLSASLNAMDFMIGESLRESNISVESLGWAFAKAKARDLENQLYSR